MDRLGQTQRSQLKRYVKLYIDSLFRNEHLVIDVEWKLEAFNSAIALSRLMSDLCGCAQNPSERALMPLNVQRADFDTYRQTRDHAPIAASINSDLASRPLLTKTPADGVVRFAVDESARLKRALLQGKAKRRRLLVVYVNWNSYKVSRTGSVEKEGHSSHLLFDTYTKRQTLVNPHCSDGFLSRVGSMIKPIVPGYSVINQSSCLNFQTTMEGTLPPDGDGVRNRGICAILNFLMCVLEMRFQIFNPHEVVRAVLSAFPTDAARRILVYEAKSFFDKCVDEPAGTHKFRTPPDPRLPCGVFCPSSGKLCQRPRCAGTGNFCWQHRHIVANADATGPGAGKCARADARPCVDVFA